MVEPPGTAPGSAVPIAHHNLSPYPVETGTTVYRAAAPKEKGWEKDPDPCPRPKTMRLAPYRFFSASRISASSSTSVGPAGAAGAASGLGASLFAPFTMRKITKAMIRKLMIAVMKEP